MNNLSKMLLLLGEAVKSLESNFSTLKTDTETSISATNTELESVKELVLGQIFPVGSVYMTFLKSFDPNTSFGGTWEQVTDDAYLKIVTADGGATGGVMTHQLSSANLPKHTHAYSHNHSMGSGKYLITSEKSWSFETFSGSLSGSGYKLPIVKTGGATANRLVTDNFSGNTGDGGFGNSAYYPGYYGVYVWKRTA